MEASAVRAIRAVRLADAEADSLIYEFLCDLARAVVGHEPPFDYSERCAMAGMLGLADARTLVYLHQTYGFPVEMSLDAAAKRGLSPDWRGLRVEFCMQLGMETDDADRRVASLRKEYELSHKSVVAA